MSIFGLGSSSGEVEIVLSTDDRKLIPVQYEKRENVPLYLDGESVTGQVQIRVKEGKKMEHLGVKIEFIGQIQLFYDRGNHFEFLSMTQELLPGGEIRGLVTLDFDFKNVEKQFESYHGINVKLRYLLFFKYFHFA